jgi:hypothetical protein
MTLDDQKEQFSFAYVRAIAAVAQVAVTEPELDDDSVDLNLRFRGGVGLIRSPQLDVQVKCTASHLLDDGHLSFALKIKNYDELRPTNVLVPRILVVVTVSQRLDEWLHHTDSELALRRCGYWISLRGMADTANVSSVTLRVPKVNRFSVESLGDIMRRVANGGFP